MYVFTVHIHCIYACAYVLDVCVVRIRERERVSEV